MSYAIWPTPGFYRVSSHFRTAERPNHMGIDIGRNISPPQPILGADIVAVADGYVSGLGFYHHSMGNWIELDHGAGLVSRYMHNDRNLVSMGQLVKQGDVIGLVGNTGRSEGAHLHFEFFLNGCHVNPLELLCPDRCVSVSDTAVSVSDTAAAVDGALSHYGWARVFGLSFLVGAVARFFNIR